MSFEVRGSSDIKPATEPSSNHLRSQGFPDNEGLVENKMDHFFEASHRLKLDMGKLEKSVENKKNQMPKAEVQNSLREEILQLEKRLQGQVAVRCALENALGFGSSSLDVTDEISIPKSATTLMKEIAILELDVSHLEQYLLSLYRKAFDQQISSFFPSSKNEKPKSQSTIPRVRCFDDSREDIISSRNGNSALQIHSMSETNLWKDPTVIHGEEKLADPGVHRCHSSVSQLSALENGTPPTAESLDKALRACHSQPLYMMEYAQSSSNIISLAEHLGNRLSDHGPEMPNKLSEDMIRCISAIYCKLSEQPLVIPGLSSPTSFLSSVTAFSPKGQFDFWSPGLKKYSSFDLHLENPFHVEGLKEFSGPYSTMVEIQYLYRDSQKLGDVDHMLQNFRSLVSQLEAVDPGRMKHEGKLSFWINIHNALVMHAFLAYGIPQNNIKRAFLLPKAAYNIGGHVISADVIQSSILRCRISRPGQWLRMLLPSRTKFKIGYKRQSYALEHPEPLLHFALCSGSHSDPTVRVYTPKKVYQELETAKEEYIRATFGMRKDHKILMPKIVDLFSKDFGLCPASTMDMIQQSLPEPLRKNLKQHHMKVSRKSIEWVPHNFTFRYLISKELLI